MSAGIFFADNSLQHEVNQLRMQEYAKASGLQVDLTTLCWRKSDDDSFVMVARDRERLVSTMRGEVIDQIQVLERKLECPWDFDLQLAMPVLLLSRAATCSSQRSGGLNLVLRYWFLRMAMEHKIRHVVGTFVSGSPREKSLKDMGYRFFENKLGWQQSTYRSLRPVQVVVLDLKDDGEQALRYCLERAGDAIERYPFSAGFPALRFVRDL